MTKEQGKEMVSLIYGQEYAKDKKIVAFYMECNDILIADKELVAYNRGYDVGYNDKAKESLN
jgi:hypothetical protein